MDPPASPDGTVREGDVAEGARAAAAPPTDGDDDDGTARAPDGGEACEWTGQSSGAPRCYFLVHNIAKKHNVGTIARCATAFGVRSVVLIGAKSYNTFGCKGSSNHVDFVHYPTLADARVGLMERQGVTKILGVEICDGAVPIETHPFDEMHRVHRRQRGRRVDQTAEGHLRRVRVRQTARTRHGVAQRRRRVRARHAPLRAVGGIPRTREGRGEVRRGRAEIAQAGVIGDDPDEVRRRRAAAREAAARDGGGRGRGRRRGRGRGGGYRVLIGLISRVAAGAETTSKVTFSAFTSVVGPTC